MVNSNRLSKEQIREALIIAGNEQLAEDRCLVHGDRAFLSAAANPSYIVITGCCGIYIESAAYNLGFRVDRPVEGGRPTRLLSAGLQVL